MLASRLKIKGFYRVLALAASVNAIAFAWLFSVGPATLPAIVVVAAVALSWAAVAAAFAAWIARPGARLAKVSGDGIVPRARALETAISAFASGNMVVRAEPAGDGGEDWTASIEAARDSLDAAISDFNSITAPPSKRICFSGCNSYEEGRVAGMQIERLLGGKGRVLGLIPSWGQVNHALRLKGCANYLAEIRSGVAIAAVRETGGAIDRAEALARELFARGCDYDLLYITDGFTPQAFCKVLGEAGGRQGGRPKLVTFDVVEENVSLLGTGGISCLIEQNMYAQTFNALVHLFNALESGWRPVAKKIFQPPMVVDSRNVGEYWEAGRKLRTITAEERRFLASPVRKRSGRRLKLGLALPTTGGFAQGLENGARAAKELLAGFGADVEIVNAFRDWQDFGTARAFGPVFDAFLAEGFDGIATCVFDAGIVPLINAASDKGVAVTTYNSEPSNFRELVENIVDNIRRLAGSSQEVAASAEEGSRADQQITKTIEGIEAGIADQRDRIAGSDLELKELNSRLAGISASIASYGALVKRITGLTEAGSVKLRESAGSSRELKGAMAEIRESVADFAKMLGEIEEIVARILGFAEDTNVLAINATIQAARAGEAGRGFSVVAGEVRKLSENSSKAAGDIKGIVESLGRRMSRLVESSARSVGLVDGNFAKSAEAEETFGAISSLVSESGTEIGSITSAMRGIAEAGESLKTNMDAVEGLSSANTGRIAEIGQAVAQLAEQAVDLSATANSLKTMAESQGLLLSQLTTGES